MESGSGLRTAGVDVSLNSAVAQHDTKVCLEHLRTLIGLPSLRWTQTAVSSNSVMEE